MDRVKITRRIFRPLGDFMISFKKLKVYFKSHEKTHSAMFKIINLHIEISLYFCLVTDEA